ncbi:MAG TPA: hypothetical protein VLB08_05955 [Candidatus Deferrimicrobium sp.]|nr:hypothetical protein [Candidatus Deferrimicrobium sp.]
MPYHPRAIAGLLVLMIALLWHRSLAAAPVPVRFIEGSLHGFLVLSTSQGVLIASGDLLQVARDGEVKSRLVFHFKDGSVLDEMVVFTQRNVFTMQSYHLVQRGPVFPEDTEISLERASGKYQVKTRTRKDGRERVRDGALDLPPDTCNGMVLTLVKNLSAGAGETVHMVAFTPAPKIIKLELAPAGEQKVVVGGIEKTATHYVLKPILGTWWKLFASLLGRTPPDNHAWIVTADVPAFVKFEGPLYMNGPVWRIELTSPRWPDRKLPVERHQKPIL